MSWNISNAAVHDSNLATSKYLVETPLFCKTFLPNASQINFFFTFFLFNFFFSIFFLFFLCIVMYIPFSVFCVLFVCKCVLYYCHRVSTQCVLYYCHRVSTQCVLYYCHRVSTQMQLKINNNNKKDQPTIWHFLVLNLDPEIWYFDYFLISL
jgi:hypothetical protein